MELLSGYQPIVDPLLGCDRSRQRHRMTNRLIRVVVTTSIALAAALLPSAGLQASCPFCSAVSQTLRQEMEAMDTAAFATIVPGSQTESDAEFIVQTVLKGSELVSPEQKLRMNYFGKAQPDQHFLVMGVDPPDLLWSTPLPVSDKAMEYISAVSQLPEDSMKRLHFYLEFLEHPESLMARDSYDEFASAPYEDIKKLKPKLDREQLLTWIEDVGLPPDRKRLYLVMLGVAGKEADADKLEEMLRSDDPNRRAGLDAMIACYATLKGEKGLALIDELFLANKKSQYADTYAAIMALRFHGTEGGVIAKDRVLESMRLILDRPELADLVIPDLARWEDWTQIEKLVKLFKEADSDSSWVRVPVINYLRACPLDKADESLAELKELDPAAFKRATSFFPIPRSGADTSDGSALVDPLQFRGLASTEGNAIELDKKSIELPKMVTAGGLPFGSTNQLFVAGVVCSVAFTLWLAMWLAISGAGNPSLAAAVLVRVERRNE